jgi:hypothetical protein
MPNDVDLPCEEKEYLSGVCPLVPCACSMLMQ